MTGSVINIQEEKPASLRMAKIVGASPNYRAVTDLSGSGLPWESALGSQPTGWKFSSGCAVYIGDAIEESPDAVAMEAAKRALLGIPAFRFQKVISIDAAPSAVPARRLRRGDLFGGRERSQPRVLRSRG